MVISDHCGMIEFIPDTYSIDYLKKNVSSNLFDVFNIFFANRWEET